MRIAPQTSIFARMTALAREHQAINLAQGLMELPPDPDLLEALVQTATTSVHQYTLPAGLPALREVIMRLSQHYFGIAYDPETEITITVGATEALYTVITALTDPGDTVVFLEPAYDSYLPAIQMAGAQPLPLRLHPPHFTIPWEALEAAFQAGARLCLLNFPHNPTGRRLYPQDLETFRMLAERYPQVTLVVDEAYELMVWEPDRPAPAKPLGFRQDSLLRERSVIVGSLGKLLGMTGWRLGYTLAPASLTTAIRTVRQFISFCAPSTLQAVAATYLQENLQRATYFHDVLLARRETARQLLSAYTTFSGLTCEGSYFFLLPTQSYTEEGDVALAKRLTRSYGVALIPLSPFYHDGHDPGYLRLCFARAAEELTEGIRRLGKAFPPGALPNGHPL